MLLMKFSRLLCFVFTPNVVLLLVASAFFTSKASHAQWFESQGTAYINNGNTDAAKTKAIENALKQSLLVAGASVSSIQQVVNGLLTQDEISIRASGTVNSLDLISETYTDNTVTVTIRADIFTQENQCFAADIKKSMLITRSKLLHREQANIGKIYDIDTELMSMLNTKMTKSSRFINASTALQNKTEFSRLNSSLKSEAIKDLAIELGHIADTQYILFSEISDVSFDSEVLNQWQFWQEDKFERNLTFTIYIYNSVSGEKTFEKSYSNVAPWQFGKRETVDLKGGKFWQSDYGNMIKLILDDVVTDIDESIMCQRTRAKIVSVKGNEIMINIGRKNNVKIGDEFTLLHLNNFKSDRGITYASYNISPYKVRITEVTEQSATAFSTDSGLLGNIQIDDLAIRE